MRRSLSFLGTAVAFASAHAFAQQSDAPIVAKLPGQQAPAASSSSDALGDYSAALAKASSTAEKPIVATLQPGNAQPPRGEPGQGAAAAPSPPTPPAASTLMVDQSGKPGGTAAAAGPSTPATVGASTASASAGGATAASPNDDSLTAATPGSKEVTAPAAQADETASGVSLVPSRTEAQELRFLNTPAAEVVLRFAREYHASIVFAGDGSTPITGWTTRSTSVESMIREIFPAPTWIVTQQDGTLVITAKPTLVFRKISLAEITPQITK